MHIHPRQVHSWIFSMCGKYPVTNTDFPNKIYYVGFFLSSFLLWYMGFFRLMYACICKYRKYSNRDNESKPKSSPQSLQFTCYSKKPIRMKVATHKVMWVVWTTTSPECNSNLPAPKKLQMTVMMISHSQVWSEIESESDTEFSEDYGSDVKIVSTNSDDDVINPKRLLSAFHSLMKRSFSQHGSWNPIDMQKQCTYIYAKSLPNGQRTLQWVDHTEVPWKWPTVQTTISVGNYLLWNGTSEKCSDRIMDYWLEASIDKFVWRWCKSFKIRLSSRPISNYF